VLEWRWKGEALMGVNVKDGTPVYGPSLCESCSNGHIQKGYRISEEIVVCAAYSPVMRVPFRVRECTSFLDKNRECLYELKKIAWEILPNRSKRTTGFFRPPEQDIEQDFELVLKNKKE
jgi:hypothetical protein